MIETVNPNPHKGQRVIVLELGMAKNDVGRQATIVEITQTWYCWSSGREEASRVPYQVKFDDGTFHWFIHNRLAPI